MEHSLFKTPGVYIHDVDAFPNSVVPVPTAVPAFIGYTPQAMFEGKSYLNKAVKINSFADFQAFFCYPDMQPTGNAVKQYNPAYYLVKQTSQPTTGNSMLIDGNYYSILPDASTIYYLYNSIKLFFENGGGSAYIVSVGTYGNAAKKPINFGEQIVNPNVQLNDLLGGLSVLLNEQEPTMYVCPEATLLSTENNAKLMQAMLLQCSTMQTAISIFDIIGGRDPDPTLYINDIATFRQNTGSNGLNFGAAYYPFIGTNIMQPGDIDYTNLFGGNVEALLPLISPVGNPNPVAAAIIQKIIQPVGASLTVTQNNNALLNASATYSTIINYVLNDANILPASGAMAGVITTTDNMVGPWQAPANTSIIGAVSLPINLSDSQQADLNVDAVSGKSINAIRFFNGIGILIWGARTLDGNSQDWRYLPVRRTITMIEQSCKAATKAFIFQPNDSNTWSSIVSMLSSFLDTLWKQGALVGSKPKDAYTVQCGLGSTMTGDDILSGYINVTITVAVTRPAEFIVITYQQQQVTAS